MSAPSGIRQAATSAERHALTIATCPSQIHFTIILYYSRIQINRGE